MPGWTASNKDFVIKVLVLVKSILLCVPINSFLVMLKVNLAELELAEELLDINSIIRKFKKHKVYSSLKDNVWGVYLADVQVKSKFNKGFRFLLCFWHL